jgi:hypothetical protein
MEVDKDIYANSSILDTSELKALAGKLGFEYNMIDLEQMGSNPHFYTFIHTGQTANEVNSGLKNHWLCVYGPHIFDSYGKYSAWKVPSNYDFVETIPKALQEYNTNVCGMYCAAYLDFCIKAHSDGSDDMGRDFCVSFGFGKNREHNDSIILSWYDSIMGKQDAGS